MMRMLLLNNVAYFLMSLNYLQSAYACANTRFLLYTRNNREIAEVITAQNVSRSNFVRRNKCFFITHGFNSTPSIDHLVAIKGALLTREDANVFMLDWSKAASGSQDEYPAISNVVPEIADDLATFIKRIGLRAETVHCIGHSLGAHVCGLAGKRSTLGRISGLDPAGPIFQTKPREEKLDRDDARFVDVIHTDLIFGYAAPIGHADFFPNGGFFQPGCSTSPLTSLDQIILNAAILAQTVGTVAATSFLERWGACSHGRAPRLYAESILSLCRFKATNCDNSFYYAIRRLRNLCTGVGNMGYYASNELRGNFYLETNSASPFCVSN